MYNCIVEITPKDSSSIEKVTWDSEHKAVTIRYKDNDFAYCYPEVDEHEFLALQGLADLQLSWGRAVYRWKEHRRDTYQTKAREAFDKMWESLHPEDKRRYAVWINQKRACGYND